MTMVTVNQTPYSLPLVGPSATLDQLEALQAGIERILLDQRAERQPFVILSPTFNVAPEQRHDPIALMVAMLNDEALSGALRRMATPGCFGEVVRDLAVTMAGAA